MNMNEIKTPALDKLLEVQDQMDLCRNFLEYFLFIALDWMGNSPIYNDIFVFGLIFHTIFIRSNKR